MPGTCVRVFTVNLLMSGEICVSVNGSAPVQLMTYRLLSTKPLLGAMLKHRWLQLWEQQSVKLEWKINDVWENAIENVICKMSSFLFKSLCINNDRSAMLLCIQNTGFDWSLFVVDKPQRKNESKFKYTIPRKQKTTLSWWRHQMETFSALLTFCENNPSVAGGFPSQRPMTLSFHVLFDLRLNKRLSKQSRRRWFETPSRSLWRHCNVLYLCDQCAVTYIDAIWRHRTGSTPDDTKPLPEPMLTHHQ